MSTPLTPAEREAAFRADLNALLEKHGAELFAASSDRPWKRSEDVEVVMESVLVDGEIIKPFTQFVL